MDVPDALVELSPNERYLVTLLATGATQAKAARWLNLTRQRIGVLLRKPKVLEALKIAKQKRMESLVETLELGERIGALTMIDLATNSRNDKVRYAAAKDLMDRASARGKAVERSESKQLVLTGDPVKALRAAINDPGVLDCIADHPELRRLLTATPTSPVLTVPDESIPPDFEVVEQATATPTEADERSESAEEALLPS